MKHDRLSAWLWALLGYCVPAVVGLAVESEIRGLWVEASSSGLRSSAEVTRLVADARAAGFNALFEQGRFTNQLSVG